MSLEDKVYNTIEDFCEDYKSFTSLDISNAVKQGGFPNARHREVAEFVRVFYDKDGMGDWDYTRTLIDVELLNGLKTKAYLYHHNTVNPDAYLDRSQVAIVPRQVAQPAQVGTQQTSQPIQPATVQDDDNVDTVQDDDEEKRSSKADGRLEIPAVWVRNLGWHAGDTVYVVIDGGDEDALTLKRAHTVSEDDEALVTTKITPDGRLRVPKTAFALSNLSGGDFIVRLDDDCIKVFDDDTVPSRGAPPPLPTVTFTF